MINHFRFAIQLSALALFITGFSCNSKKNASDLETPTTMRATITSTKFYKDIPSASGLEVVGDSIYIIGDDSPYLYHLDKDFKIRDKTTLSDTAGFSSGRVAKSEKLDLESIASFEDAGKTYLLILGSGAAEPRRKALMAEIDPSSGKVGQVHTYSLHKLYEKLQQDTSVVGSGLLNIEGAAVEKGKLYLLQRAIAQEPNVVLVFDLSSFISYLRDKGDVPDAEFKPFHLAEINGYQAGFSGAHIFDGKLFFTASVEETEDAIADGEVLGSYIGYVNLADLTQSDNKKASPVSARLLFQDGKGYTGKAESLIVSAGDKKGSYKVLVVSDDDQGHSELLEVDLTEQ